MDSSRNNLCPDDVTELLSMLESSDAETVDSVKALIHENLNGTKDVWLLHCLIDYHIAVQSKHALEIIIRIREPHDKHLFDKITEYLKNENKRYSCLLLLSHIVHKQPPWLHKITQYRIFSSLLLLLKSEKDSPSLLCALFTMVCLLPMIPTQIGPYLNDIFEIFSRLASWSVKNSIGVPQVYVLHLQVGVYTLFHRLYGMYPCNFLAYLRSFYGRREYKEENLCVFANAIKPMLQKVKLHPLLVTACKETELSQNRWRGMAPHDIVVECANISLDAIESAGDDSQVKSNVISSGLSGQLQSCQENSSQLINFNSQNNSSSIIVEHCVSENEISKTKHDSLHSPLLHFDNVVSHQVLTTSDGGCSTKHHVVSKLDTEPVVIDVLSSKKIKDANSPDVIEKVHCIGSKFSNNADVAEALEAKEEELADNEVSELTSSPSSSNPKQEHLESRHDTPFCSTTQNLTDMPLVSDAKLIDSTKDEDEQIEVESPIQSELKMERVVQTINRFRYFSHCCTPSSISNSNTQIDKCTVQRSSSCPNINYFKIHTNFVSHCYLKENSNAQVVSSISTPSVPTNTSSYCKNSVCYSSLSKDSNIDTHYDHLIPMVVQPVSSIESNSRHENSSCIRHIDSSSSCTFSPEELLDRHILLSKDAFMGQLNSIPLTSTKKINWTHFGGSPPPDEIKILQTQILLLHNQLMFERHRREIHGERNRRLLGKARRSRMQEEYTAALKDQVSLLENENLKFRKQMKEAHKLYCTLYEEKKMSDYHSDCTIKKLLQEKTELQYTIKKIQSLLVAQKQEIDIIQKDKELSESQSLDLELENEVLKHDLSNYSRKENEIIELSKQNILLHELNQLYVDRLEMAKEPKVMNETAELVKDSVIHEIKGLKQRLESKSAEVEFALSRISELEAEISSLKFTNIEKARTIETLTVLHKNEIEAREDRLHALKKIIQRCEAHILELYCVQETLNNKIESFTQKESSTVVDCSKNLPPVPSSSDSNCNKSYEFTEQKKPINSEENIISVNI